ncbi:hypothetical protein WJX73_008209 [Symbiochloris irregularis]|uniref:Heme oxygenase n=1 Tax=Symbiochloris irregularis TaxID=706552 RepID=A0AAW1PNG4_9CHLO
MGCSLSNGLVATRLLIVCTRPKLYARALANFYFIHAAIDAALQKYAHLPAVAPIAALLPRAGRKQAFETDLQFFLGQDWKEKLGRPPPAVQQYLDHFEALCKDADHDGGGAGIVAHAYTQQTAMFFGGQRLSKMVRSNLALEGDDPGTSAFEYSEPVHKLKQDYMRAIDGLARVLGEDGVQKMIAERELVFQMNNKIIKSFKLPRFAYHMKPIDYDEPMDYEG